MSYNYTQFISALSTLAGTSSTTPGFVIELPNAIDYGEQRIFRDLDLIANVTSLAGVCLPNNRNLPISGLFVALNALLVYTPFGTNPGNGIGNPLVPVSQDVINFLAPDPSVSDVPRYYHYQTQGYGGIQGNVLLAPSPDKAYAVAFIGTERPVPLSGGNPNTFLSTNLPDLLLIACMIHMAAYQKNWSSIGNDPGAGTTFEQQYQKLLLGADAEELRKRYSGSTVIPPAGMNKQPASPDAKP